MLSACRRDCDRAAEVPGLSYMFAQTPSHTGYLVRVMLLFAEPATEAKQGSELALSLYLLVFNHVHLFVSPQQRLEWFL